MYAVRIWTKKTCSYGLPKDENKQGLFPQMIKHIQLATVFTFLMSICPPAAAVDSENDIVNSIVNIQIDKVRSWDDGYNSSSKGTGFIIDSKRGYILTNKHIIGVGPVIAYGEFSNKRSIQLVPVYRDPVHDFGVFQYDPKEVSDLAIEAIELNASAKVGEKIRLYGNDGGNDLSIIEGVLSRIDRTAPEYNNTHTDFNTFYFQAALGSTGGSSGSPILNDKNQTIALNSGSAKNMETAFFLPMEMIIPTLRKLLGSESVSRGSLQTIFEYTPYSQFTSLGIDEVTLNTIKSKAGVNSKGKLVVAHVIPEGPGEEVFNPGDIMLSLDGVSVDNFLQFETLLNANVGQRIKVQILRNGQKIENKVLVDDLFKLTPDEYIEYSNGLVIPVGLTMARLFNLPVRGVTLANPGPVFSSQGIMRLAILDEIENEPVNNIDDFANLVSRIAKGEKYSVRYRDPNQTKLQQYKLVNDYSDWYDTSRCKSQMRERHWKCKKIKPKPTTSGKPLFTAKKAATSMIVDVEVFRPVLVNSLNDIIRRGHGAVVDYNNGYILTDRSIVDSSLSVVHVTLNNGVRIPASVAAIHPYLNLVLIKSDLSKVRFSSGSLAKMSNKKINADIDYRFIGKSSMLDVELNARATWPVKNDNVSPHDSMGFVPSPDFFGVYVNRENQISAINTRYVVKKDSTKNDVIPATLINQFLQAVKKQSTGMFELEAAFTYLGFGEALNLGMHTVEVDRTDRVLSVANIEASGESNLLPGDIVIGAEHSVQSINDLYAAVKKETVNLDVLRNGKRQSIGSKAKLKDFEKFKEVVFYGGSFIHAIDDKFLLSDAVSEACLLVGLRFFGTPASRGFPNGRHCIYEVDGERVFTIADIVRLTQNKNGGDYTRIKTIELNNNYRVSELQLREDPFYWPTRYWKIQDGTWQEQ
jgi:S1-C subfamily serine protease